MLLRKLFFLLPATLILTLPCLGMNGKRQPPPISLKKLGPKYLVTEKHVTATVDAVKKRPGAEILADELSHRLATLVGQALSSDDWDEAVAKVYDNVVDALDLFNTVAILKDHPLQQILQATSSAFLKNPQPMALP